MLLIFPMTPCVKLGLEQGAKAILFAPSKTAHERSDFSGTYTEAAGRVFAARHRNWSVS